MDELEDEWDAQQEEIKLLSEEGIRNIEDEIADLEAFRDLAVSITQNAKGRALIKALKVGIEKTEGVGAAKKAIIFTESRKTQNYP